MTCLEDKKNVRKFLEDLLDETEYQRVRQHVVSCEACRQLTHAAGSISSMLMDMAHQSTPSDLVDSILYEYEKGRRAPAAQEVTPPVDLSTIEKPSSGQSQAPWLRILLAALIVCLAFFIWKDIKRPSQAELPAQQPAQESSSSGFRDTQWTHARLRLPNTERAEILDWIKRCSGEIRYEAEGFIAVRIPSHRDSDWHRAFEGQPDALIESVRSPKELDDASQLYSIRYGQD